MNLYHWKALPAALCVRYYSDYTAENRTWKENSIFFPVLYAGHEEISLPETFSALCGKAWSALDKSTKMYYPGNAK
jgi:hypothetical protein